MFLKYLKIALALVGFTIISCNDNKTSSKPKIVKKLNTDSLLKAKQQSNYIWETYKRYYGCLSIDSLSIDSVEKYRLVIKHGWSNKFGGNPTSITFYKTPDTCYVVIKDAYDTNKTWVANPKLLITKSVKFIPSNYFDSIRLMFNSGTFWRHPIQTPVSKSYRIQMDGNHFFAEAVKNGKHKILYQSEIIDSLPILSTSWMITTYKFSNYSKLFNEDLDWLKKHPSDEEHMPSYRKKYY